MKPLQKFFWPSFAGLLFLSSCASYSHVEPNAMAVLTKTTDKLKSAKTFHISGTRTADPSLLPPGSRREVVKFDLEAIRPGNLEAKLADASSMRHLIAGNGKITYYDETAKVYSSMNTKAATIEALVDEIEDQFDVKMVVAEMLGADPKKDLLQGVTAGKVVGDEMVNGALCTRLSFSQKDLAWDLWIAKGDALPRQAVVIYANRPGQPRRTVTVDRWRLNEVLPESDFVFRLPWGVEKVDVIH
jgi:hypothetical protein